MSAQTESPNTAPVQLSDNGFPRRNRVDLYTPAEQAIAKAIGAVEAAGAHPLLTDAVILLGQAQAKVADFVEWVPDEEKHLDLTIILHPGTPAQKNISVLQYYRSKKNWGGRLPATPTMSGLDVKVAGRIEPSYSLWLSGDGTRRDTPISDNEAIALHDGMKFYVVPPATY